MDEQQAAFAPAGPAAHRRLVPPRRLHRHGAGLGGGALPAHNGVKSNYASYWVNGISKAEGEKLEAARIPRLRHHRRGDAFLAREVGELPARKDAAMTDENAHIRIYGPFIKGLEYAEATHFVQEGPAPGPDGRGRPHPPRGQTVAESVAAAAAEEQTLLDQFYGG